MNMNFKHSEPVNAPAETLLFRRWYSRPASRSAPRVTGISPPFATMATTLHACPTPTTARPATPRLTTMKVPSAPYDASHRALATPPGIDQGRTPEGNAAMISRKVCRSSGMAVAVLQGSACEHGLLNLDVFLEALPPKLVLDYGVQAEERGFRAAWFPEIHPEKKPKAMAAIRVAPSVGEAPSRKIQGAAPKNATAISQNRDACVRP